MVKSGKARAHTNIALIKYWGKADEAYIIPMNNSLSITLDRFYTETKVTFDSSLTEDKLILNGEKVDDKETAKIQNIWILSEKLQIQSYMRLLKAKTLFLLQQG